jgi:hypothetical protein
VKLALEEDVDVVGISSLATDHLIVPKLMTALREAGLGNVRVVVGGIVPDNEEKLLIDAGVREVFHPGSTMDDITAACASTRARRGAPKPAPTRRPDMNKPVAPRLLVATETAHERWQREFKEGVADEREIANVSGIPIRPLYTAADRAASGGDEQLGHPGQPDYTRGIYATMHRGRTWTQRQLVGLGTPADYNQRLLGLLDRGATAVSLIPCNSVYRGYDMDSVEPELLGTCGVVVNNADHMDRCLEGVDVGEISCAMNDPSPFTLLAFMLVAAERRGIDWNRSPAPRTRATTSRTTSPTTCSTGSRCRARARADGPHRVCRSSCRAGTRCRWSASTCSRRARRRPRRWRSRSRARCRTPRTASPAAWTPTSSCRASPSSSTSRSASSRRSPSSAPAGASGRGSRASASARRTRRRGASSSTPRPRAST